VAALNFKIPIVMSLNKSWHKYNESLIERGQILMDIGFLESSKSQNNTGA